MADTCAKGNNDVWFGAKPLLDEPVLYGSEAQVAWDMPAANDTCPSGLRPGGASRSAWARTSWRGAPKAATPRGWGH